MSGSSVPDVFDIDDRVSLRGFRPEDRQDLVNGLNERVGSGGCRTLTGWIMPMRSSRETNIFMLMRRYGTAAAAYRWRFVPMMMMWCLAYWRTSSAMSQNSTRSARSCAALLSPSLSDCWQEARRAFFRKSPVLAAAFC